MPEEKIPATKATRRYNSPRRQEQSVNTKARIVDAAIAELREKGYAEMSLDSIAKKAGVASQTVYGLCGSKKGMLDIIQQNYRLSEEYKQIRSQELDQNKGPEWLRAIGMYSTVMMESRLPTYRLARAMRAASRKHSHLATRLEDELYDLCYKLVLGLAEDGLLRSGLDVDTAAEICWALHSPEMHRRLTDDKGWSTERYSAWFGEVLACMLLAPGSRTDLIKDWMPQAKPDKG